MSPKVGNLSFKRELGKNFFPLLVLGTLKTNKHTKKIYFLFGLETLKYLETIVRLSSIFSKANLSSPFLLFLFDRMYIPIDLEVFLSVNSCIKCAI